jgi:NTP pyrophosphatase (non-canonical NTP hydrolase)
MTKTLNRLRDEAYQNSVEHGFHDSDNEMMKTMAGLHALIAQRIALIHSELSEALEADRKERYANLYAFNCKRQQTPTFVDRFKVHIKDTFEDELADAMIRILDLCGWMDIDIQRHVELKMQYNAGREKMHGKKY